MHTCTCTSIITLTNTAYLPCQAKVRITVSAHIARMKPFLSSEGAHHRERADEIIPLNQSIRIVVEQRHRLRNVIVRQTLVERPQRLPQLAQCGHARIVLM